MSENPYAPEPQQSPRLPDSVALNPRGEAVTSETPVRNGLWLWYLYFQPRRFFQHFVIDEIPVLTAICGWTYGMALAIDRIETRHGLGQMDFSGWTWSAHLALVTIGGAVAGLMYYAIGGWWYRRRLIWSGAYRPDPYLARRVLVYAAQVVAVPTVISMVIEIFAFDRPIDALRFESLWWLILLIFPFWSVWTSYRGVRTVFDLRAGLARLWFLVLPTSAYVLVFGVFGVVGVMLALVEPADVKNPQQFRGPTMTFSYPGNWGVDDTDSNFDLEAYVPIIANQDAYFLITLYESEMSLADEFASSVENLKQDARNWRQEQPIAQWGGHQGAGVSAVGDTNGGPIRYHIFLTSIDDQHVLEIWELCAVSDQEKAQPGFDLIQSTLKIDLERVETAVPVQ